MIMPNAKIPMTNQIQNPNDKNRSPLGFSALLTVLVIGVVALAMAHSASMLGLGELDLGYTAQKGGEAFAVADGCLEETMRRIRLNTNYGVGAGVIALTIANNSCTITVDDIGGNQRRLTVSGNASGYYKKIQAIIILTGNIITLNSWEERSD